jgi:hypothetical protein
MLNTVQFHRVLRATPDRVYGAFLDADAKVKWLEGIPDISRADACVLGWQESIVLLAKLVEAEIRD